MVDLCNVGTLFAFVLVCIGIIVLRLKDPDRQRPFKVPGGIIVPVLGIISCITLMYGLTPNLLLGWIPFIGFIAGIWSLVIEIVGIRQLHELTTGKAILAIVLLIKVSSILALIFAAAMMAFIFGMGGRSPYGY